MRKRKQPPIPPRENSTSNVPPQSTHVASARNVTNNAVASTGGAGSFEPAPPVGDAHQPPPFLGGVPQVTGFTAQHQSQYVSPLSHYVPDPSRYKKNNEQSYAFFARPAQEIPHPLPQKETRFKNPDIDPVLAEAFSREPVDPQLEQALTENPVIRTRGKYDPWRDPESAAVLGEPAHSREKTWKAKVIHGRRLGIREILFGRVVSPGAIVSLLVVALLLATVGGLVGRLTAEHPPVKLHSERPKLSIDHTPTRDTGLVSLVQQVSPMVVQIIVSMPNGAAFGSGVIVDPQGYIWTNNHVVAAVAKEKNPDVKVVFSDRSRVDANIVGVDPLTDVAVLKVEVDNLHVATLGDSDVVKPGQPVFAVGGPLGIYESVTSGIVSAVHRPWVGPKDTPMIDDCIQTDTAVNPGNSGGPLFDYKGHVIGITNGGNAMNGAQVGVNYAISVNYFRKIAQKLQIDGKYEHPWLGISFASIVRKGGSGAKIVDIAINSPADKAGLHENDVVIAVNGHAITDMPEMSLVAEELTIGKSYTVEFIRNGKKLSTTITPARRGNS